MNSPVSFSETTDSVRKAGVSVFLEPVTPVVICKILFVQIVLKGANKSEQMLSL